MNNKEHTIKKFDETAIRQDYIRLTKTLIEKKLTISTMESATSGQIASLITDTEGASSIIKGAFVTYSNDAKIMQGVPENIIDTYSVYSKETASAMAESCRESYGANIGIGVTGTMGNVDTNNIKNSVPGRVFFAISIDGNVTTYQEEIPPQESRLMYKLAVAKLVYDQLIVLLEEI